MLFHIPWFECTSSFSFLWPIGSLLERLLLLGYQPAQFFSTKSDASLVVEIMGNDRHEQSANAILPFKHGLMPKRAGFCGKFSGNVKGGRPKGLPFFIECIAKN
jgi:hypothetical protein